MGYSLIIPEISATSGELNDGISIGRINQSNPVGALLGESVVAIAPTIFNTYDNNTEIDWVAVKKFIATEPAFLSAVQ